MLLPLLVLASLGDWPGWRGPSGMGRSDSNGLPVSWSARPESNVLWTHDLDFGPKSANDHNQSSPIVVGGLVVVCHSWWPEGSSKKQFPEHAVRALSLGKGDLRWQAKVAPGPWSRASDLRGGYTAPTPASDGKRIYACFGSSVLAALDLDGKLLWRKEIVPSSFDVALASSPVVVGDTVVMQLDGVSGSSRISAFDGKTGDIRWNEKRPRAGFSHSTPVLAKVKGKTQLLVAANNQLQGVDPASGKILWHASASGDTASAVLADGLAYLDSGRGGKGTCVDATGEGDVSRSHTKWSIGAPGGFASPLAIDGLLYRVADPGVLRVWRMKDGKEVAALRVPGASTAASPVATADGRIYLATAGKSYVIQAGEKPEILGKGDLGDASSASPAIAGGKLILRGARKVWCIGMKPE